MPALVELLAPLTALVLFIVALGLTLVAVPLVRAIIGGIAGLVGHLPIVGTKASSVARKVENSLIATIGRVALSMEQQGVRFFHATGQLLDWQARELEHLAVDALRHWRWLKYAYLPSLILTATGGDKALNKYLHALEKKVGHAEATAQHGVRVAAHGAVADRLVAVEHELVQWRGYTTRQLRRSLARLRALEEAVYGQAVALPGEIGGIVRGRLAGINGRVGRLEKIVLGAGAVALVTRALAKLRLGWLRCSNVGKVGRRLCGMDASLLEDLLSASLLIVGSISIVQLAEELQGVMDDAVTGFEAFVREL